MLMERLIKLKLIFCFCIGFVVSVTISCNKNEEQVMIDSEADIRFGAIMVDSRSMVERPEDMNAFRVWAWRMHTNSSNNSQVFDGNVITYSEGANVWNYENPRVWYLNNTYNFYALYPDTITNASYNENGKLTIPRLDIRQTDEYNNAKVVDLMKATQYVEVGMNPPETVNLTFTHMLTNVNIELKKHINNANDEMEVTYILLNGINCVGSMQDDVWSLSEPSYLWDKLNIPQTLSNNASPCFSNVLMLPQVIKENQVTLYVVYSYQQAGGTTMTKMLETSLPAGEWKAGEKIVYTGTIQVDNSIVFDTPQVESWGTEQVGGTVVIK